MTSITELKNRFDHLSEVASKSQLGNDSPELQQSLSEVRAKLEVACRGLFQVAAASQEIPSERINAVYHTLTGQDGNQNNKPAHFQGLYNAIEHVAKLLTNGQSIEISDERLKLAVLETLPAAENYAPVELKSAIKMARIATLAQAPNPAMAGRAFDDPSLFKSPIDVLDQNALTHALHNLGVVPDNITDAKNGLKRFLMANESLNAQAINLIDQFDVAAVMPNHVDADVKAVQQLIFGEIVNQLTNDSANNFGKVGEVIQALWDARTKHTASVPSTTADDKNRLRSLITQNIGLITDASKALKPSETAIKDLSEKVYESRREMSARVKFASVGKGFIGINWDKHLKPRKLVYWTSGLKSSLNPIAHRIFPSLEDLSSRTQLRRAVDPIRRELPEPTLRGLKNPELGDLTNATDFARNLLGRFSGTQPAAYSEQDDTDHWSLFNAALLSNGYTQPQISRYERRLQTANADLIGQPRGKSFDDMANNRTKRGLKVRVLTSLSPAKMHDSRYSSTDNMRIMFKAMQGELVRQFAGSGGLAANEQLDWAAAAGNIDRQIDALVDSASTPQMLSRVASFAYTALQPERAQSTLGQQLYNKVIRMDLKTPGENGWEHEVIDKDAIKDFAKQLLKFELKGVSKEEINNAQRQPAQLDALPGNADWAAGNYNVDLPVPQQRRAQMAQIQPNQPAVVTQNAQDLDRMGFLGQQRRLVKLFGGLGDFEEFLQTEGFAQNRVINGTYPEQFTRNLQAVNQAPVLRANPNENQSFSIKTLIGVLAKPDRQERQFDEQFLRSLTAFSFRMGSAPNPERAQPELQDEVLANILDRYSASDDSRLEVSDRLRQILEDRDNANHLAIGNVQAYKDDFARLAAQNP